MHRSDAAKSSVAPEVGNDDGQSHSSHLPFKHRPGSTLSFLADSFVPGKDDVVCGRGKKCYSHTGNERFKARVVGVLDEYSKAKSKLDKSGVLNQVIAEVRRASPAGGFVKQDESGRWYEVGDFLAREKTSQAFRDALHQRYKSSSVSKKKRRQEVLVKFTEKSQMRKDYSTEEVGSTVELSTTNYFQTNTGDAQQNLLPYSHSLQRTNQSNSNLTPAFGVSPVYSMSSVLSPRGPSSSIVHALDAYAHRSFSRLSSHRPGHAFPYNNAPFVTNRQAFQLVFEDDGTAPNLRSLPDMRYDVHASTPMLHDQMHHSLPNMHFNYKPETTRSVLPVLTQYDAQLRAFRDPTSARVSMERHQGRQSNQTYSLDFEPEFAFQSPSMDSETTLVDGPPVHNSGASCDRAARDTSARKLNRSSSPDDHELLQCLDKLTEYRLSDDNPYEPVPLGTGQHNPP